MSRFINPVYEVQNKTIRCGQFVTGVSGRVYNVNNKRYRTTSEKSDATVDNNLTQVHIVMSRFEPTKQVAGVYPTISKWLL